MPSNVENSVRVIWLLILRIVLAVAAVYFAYRVRSVVICVVVSVFLAYALLPGVEWLCRRRVRRLNYKTQRLIATILVFIVALGFAAGIVTLTVVPFTRELSQFRANVTKKYTGDLTERLRKAGEWYEERVPSSVKGAINNIDYKQVSTWLMSRVGALLNATRASIGVLMELFLIPVLAFYFVLDYKSISREMYGLVPRGRRREAIRLGRDTGEIMQSYVTGQIILCVIAGVLTAAFLTIVGMPYVVVLALFAGITRAIPVIGPVVSGIPIVLVGIVYGGWGMAGYLLLFVIVMHFAESKFIMPRLIGERMQLHPAVVIIVLLIGAEFFGLLGMFVAAPVAAVVRNLLRTYYIQPRRQRLEAAGAAVEAV